MPNHIDIDITADPTPGNPPRVVFRGAPAGTYPVLDTANGDEVQWHNDLTEDITISIPWAKHVVQGGHKTIELGPSEDSLTFKVKSSGSVSDNYKKKLSYTVLAEDSVEYGQGYSDPLIEIK